MIRLSSYLGNEHLGVFCAANQEVAFVPPGIPPSLEGEIVEALDVRTVRTTLAGTNVLGALLNLNSHGAVVSGMAMDSEVDLIAEEMDVLSIDDRINAAGNNVLTTDSAAIVNPDMARSTIGLIEDVLDIECVPMSVGGHMTVGSACVANNLGIICHPRATEDEIDALKAIFKVPVKVGTLNYGTPLVGACIVANDHGAVVGDSSTPIELGRLEDGLGYI